MRNRPCSWTVALATPTAIAVTVLASATGQPATTSPGLGPVPWAQRAITADVADRTVTSDLGPGRTERWIAAVLAGEQIVAELLGTRDLLARAIPPRTLLLFDDPAEYRRTLAGRYGQPTGGTAAVTFLFDNDRVTAATVAPPGPAASDPMSSAGGNAAAAPAAAAPATPAAAPAAAPPAAPGPPATRDLAAAAADLLPVAVAAAFDRPFEDDLAPALAGAIGLLAAESIVLDGAVVPGHPLPETLVAAQVVLRDRTPDLPAILAVDDRGWSELGAEQQGDATLAAWSLVQYATTREGQRARAILRSLAARVNAGDLPPIAVERAATAREWQTVIRGWQRWLEDVPPDPTGRLVVLVEALAAGLAELAADGVIPADVEEAATALADRDFTWRAIRQGQPVEIVVEGPQTFVLDEDMASGRRPQIQLGRSRPGRPDADAPPPGIDVRATRLGRLVVEWDRADDGWVRRLYVR